MNTSVHLYGPRDLRLSEIDPPDDPGAGQVLLRVGSVGVCGSDLHMYEDGRIGDTAIPEPFILGHEFGGTVEAVGEDAIDGKGVPLSPGTRVAVDPAIPCGRCETCRAGHPNLCPDHRFIGVYPTSGALRETIVVPAEVCFAVPDTIGDDVVPLLETLGVAIHAIDLAHIRVGYSVAVIGAGSVGQCVAQVARLAGAAPLFVSDRHGWRLDAAADLASATPVNIDTDDPVEAVMRATGGRGVDVTIEAAWSDEHAINQAVDMLRPGGRLVVVGISGDDALRFRHSAVRRKGVTIAMCRRMKHTYPRAIALTACGDIRLGELVSHRFPLAETERAFDVAVTYESPVIKSIVRVG